MADFTRVQIWRSRYQGSPRSFTALPFGEGRVSPSTRMAAQGATGGFEQGSLHGDDRFTFGFRCRVTPLVYERTEEVLDHFGAEIAHALVGKFGPYIRCGRPEISSAQRAKHSSIGSPKPKRQMSAFIAEGNFLTLRPARPVSSTVW